MRRNALFLALALGTTGLAGHAWALPNLTSESGFLFDFTGTRQGTLTNGSRDAYDGCYELAVDGTTYDADGAAYEDWYDGRGFRSAEQAIGAIAVRRHAFVPETGGSFARYIDTFRNDGAEDVTITIAYECNLGSDANTTLESSDGQASPDVDDPWVVTDDADGAGDPSLAHVLAQDGAAVALSSIEHARGMMDWSYEVSIPAGHTVAILLFAVQEDTRALAQAAAETLAILGDQALEAAGDEVLDVANFSVGPAGAPRLHANGPYHVAEGGTVELGIVVDDPDGDAVAFSWDLDGDGAFGEAAGEVDPVIDASDVDGPATLPLAVELTDGTHTIERTVVVRVDNVPPSIESVPPTGATTDETYEYSVVATDFPSDELGYEIALGPDGMTVSPEGLVRWRPAGDGRASVDVTLRVTDDDGGVAEQQWSIALSGGPVIAAGGPYRVAEGGEIDLVPEVMDPEGDALTYAWDLDGDGAPDDGEAPTATFSARGIDGPSERSIGLVVFDGTHLATVAIPVTVQNAPPVFASVPAATAVLGRPWTYGVQAIDPGEDRVELEIDPEDLPLGMTFDAAALVLTWTPNERATLEGDPPGHYAFTIAAEDDDGARARQDVAVSIGTNQPPPVPRVHYPDGTTPVTVAQPTILLENVTDPDGDPVQVFVEVDADPCFCSSLHQASDALEPGELAIRWTLPRPLDPVAAGTNRFYLRRWANDGLSDSEKQLSLFDLELSAEPGADGGPEGIDADGGPDDGSDGAAASCACRTGGAGGAEAGWALLLLPIAAAVRRRRRRSGADLPRHWAL